jgi:hypothetical protein
VVVQGEKEEVWVSKTTNSLELREVDWVLLERTRE